MPAEPTVHTLLLDARRQLAATPFGAPPREAGLLLGHVLGLSEVQVLTHPERPVADAAAAQFGALLARRLTGEPVAYLLGEREFYGRPFHVDSRVLIPRPETEHVVEAALGLGLPDGARIVDVGTGSGCLAVTLALEVPGAFVVATDLSPGALAVAAGNARRHGVEDRVHLLAADLMTGLDLAGFDLAVSNPPYIDRSEAPLLSPEVCNFEPHLALFSPDAGDSTLARLFRESEDLPSGAFLVVEIGYGQLDAARRHASASPLQLTAAWKDYSGIPRVLILRRR
ncbi:MAG TPA: peptide chain release factor N(5)-glutamine methyltransferase [Thermoanaerobaculia bacterium]|nr:peptide chain release factor N(5)-glutamine methyltransferase [Thermoanaerobaculia bacterium]